MLNRFSLFLIELYKKFIAPLTVGSCRYYPSCSEYAKWSFSNFNFFIALYKTTIRILRCNKFFSGGIDYPKGSIYGLEKRSQFLGSYKKVLYWYVPDKNKKDFYSLIKSLR